MGVAVDQDLQHQPRVIRRTAPNLGVAGVDLRQVQPVLNQIINSTRRMISRQPVTKIRGQQHRLILVITPERLIHRHFRSSRARLHDHQHGLLGDQRLRHAPFCRNPNPLRVTDTGP